MGKFGLLDMKPEQVADQWTLLDMKDFLRIDPGNFLSPGEHWNSMLSRATALSRWVASEVVQVSSPQGRAEVVQMFLDIALRFLENKNFNGLMSVWGGLNSVYVHRLSKTHKRISRKYADIQAGLALKLSEDYNFYQLRKAMEKHRKKKEPVVPWFELTNKLRNWADQYPDYVDITNRTASSDASLKCSNFNESTVGHGASGSSKSNSDFITTTTTSTTGNFTTTSINFAFPNNVLATPTTTTSTSTTISTTSTTTATTTSTATTNPNTATTTSTTSTANIPNTTTTTTSTTTVPTAFKTDAKTKTKISSTNNTTTNSTTNTNTNQSLNMSNSSSSGKKSLTKAKPATLHTTPSRSKSYSSLSPSPSPPVSPREDEQKPSKSKTPPTITTSEAPQSPIKRRSRKLENRPTVPPIAIPKHTDNHQSIPKKHTSERSRKVVVVDVEEAEEEDKVYINFGKILLMGEQMVSFREYQANLANLELNDPEMDNQIDSAVRTYLQHLPTYDDEVLWKFSINCEPGNHTEK